MFLYEKIQDETTQKSVNKAEEAQTPRRPVPMDPPTPIEPNLTGASLARAAYNASKAKLEQILAAINTNITDLQESSSDWRKIESAANDIRKKLPKIIKFDVGGTIFATSPNTILDRFPMSLLSVIISTNVWVPSDGVYFFDRSPHLFSVVLDYYREGILDVATLDSTDDIKALVAELDFFCVPYRLNEENVPTTMQEAFPVISPTFVNSFVENASATVSEAKEMFTLISSFVETERIESVSRTKQWQDLIDVIKVVSKEAKDKVTVNYGGQYFTSTAANLSKCEYFAAQLTRWRAQGDNAPIFVDRNPMFFGFVLEYLRTGHWRPSEMRYKLKQKLFRELDYLSFHPVAPPFFDSSVVDKTFMDKLGEWLPGNAFSLLYRASRDGWGQPMRSKMDCESPLLFVARTSPERRVIGAYTSVSFSRSGAGGMAVRDPNCFIFGISSEKPVRAVWNKADPPVITTDISVGLNIHNIMTLRRDRIAELYLDHIGSRGLCMEMAPGGAFLQEYMKHGRSVRIEELEVFAVVSSI